MAPPKSSSNAEEALLDAAEPFFRKEVENEILKVQDGICEAVENLEGCAGAKFIRDDPVILPLDGGEGKIITRVLTNCQYFEKAAVNVTFIFPEDKTVPRKVPYAAAIDGALHPRNPLAPAVQFSYRYLEPPGPDSESKWFFEGDTYLLPTSTFYQAELDKFFKFQEDKIANKFSLALYEEFKRNCDDYFVIKLRLSHVSAQRGRREPVKPGLGGVYFSTLHKTWGIFESFAVFSVLAEAVSPSYIPLVKSRGILNRSTDPTGYWTVAQQQKRALYVEFFLLSAGIAHGSDKDVAMDVMLTTFPPTASWPYPFDNFDEAAALKLLK